MWPRIIEALIGCWLVISPFVFRHSPDDQMLRMHDLWVGCAIVTCAFMSFWRPFRYAHFILIPIAGWLIVFTRWMGSVELPAYQNHIVVGCLLVMFAILPNDVNSPPEEWREPTP